MKMSKSNHDPPEMVPWHELESQLDQMRDFLQVSQVFRKGGAVVKTPANLVKLGSIKKIKHESWKKLTKKKQGYICFLEDV